MGIIFQEFKLPNPGEEFEVYKLVEEINNA